ncbi:DUF222 domain-containing protein [Kutzneria sp. NPDC051319]|uniref:DUF222 domain-containing protein n=1 Tax=Kutzneria sp. NPDC051319 TaxID=3155047 RepID=UPI0034399EB7
MNPEVARMIECEREIRRLQAEQLRLIATLDVDEWTAHDIGPALQLSPSNASDRVKWARTLHDVHPTVLDALHAGVISERSAHALVDPTEYYPPELAHRAIAKTLETAAGRSPQQLRRSCQARLQRADPAIHLQRRDAARRSRKVVLFDAQDGLGIVSCSQPIEIAHAIYAKIDRLAAHEPKNGRNLDEIRADVMAGLILEDPKTAGLKPLIQVTVPLTALLGVDERPGTLATGQLIPAPVVRELMSHPGTLFHRLLTDPAGHLVEYTPKLYRPKVGVDRFLRARHQTCVMPCCSHPSRSCDIDHATPWPVGESTGTNMAPLDRRHHRYKHATNADVSIAKDGTTTVTTRWGLTYVTKPEPLDEPPF